MTDVSKKNVQSKQWGRFPGCGQPLGFVTSLSVEVVLKADKEST